MDKSLSQFLTFNRLTIILVYMLILIGASVRASGAGMGCPDWPTCFGQWIPPTHVAQLPENYQEIYAERGYADTPFNAVKTWTEYLNRLFGVLTGLFITVSAILGFRARRIAPRVAVASSAAFVLVCIQGWLGAQLVASNLMPGMITVHMVMALLIVSVLLYGSHTAAHQLGQGAHHAVPAKPLYILTALLFVQMVMGTQVREMIDALKQGEMLRTFWVQSLSWVFYVHRSFSAVLLATVLYLLYRSGPAWRGTLYRSLRRVLALMILTIAVGATLGHFHMPKIAQPFHLLFAALLYGQLLVMVLQARTQKRA